MPESQASVALHMLQSELNGAKTQWEYLQDRIVNGYRDAYKLHLDTLKEMHKARLIAEQRAAQLLAVNMFVFSVVSVGFAGGLIGGLIAPWVRKVQSDVAAAAIREGVKGIAARTTQQSIARLVPEKPSPPSSNGSDYPFVPASPEAFDVYIEKKEALDGCFAEVNACVQRMIDLANTEQWQDGQIILDSFRQYCRLLTDAPDPAKLPDKSHVTKTAELALWVAWANVRDFPWWNEKVFSELDGPASSIAPDFLEACQWAFELDPVLIRFSKYGVEPMVESAINFQTFWGRSLEVTLRQAENFGGVGTQRERPADFRDKYLDLRKLRQLRLQHIPDLPLRGMEKLDLGWAQSNLRLDGVKFLDGLRDYRPFHIANATTP